MQYDCYVTVEMQQTHCYTSGTITLLYKCNILSVTQQELLRYYGNAKWCIDHVTKANLICHNTNKFRYQRFGGNSTPIFRALQPRRPASVSNSTSLSLRWHFSPKWTLDSSIKRLRNNSMSQYEHGDHANLLALSNGVRYFFLICQLKFARYLTLFDNYLAKYKIIFMDTADSVFVLATITGSV
jgi:hypothetical protein